MINICKYDKKFTKLLLSFWGEDKVFKGRIDSENDLGEVADT